MLNTFFKPRFSLVSILIMCLVVQVGTMIITANMVAHAQDNGQTDLVSAMQQIDELRKQVEIEQANAANAVQAAGVSMANLQVQVAAQIAAAQAIQSRALAAIEQSQRVQEALNQAQYSTAVALSGQAADMALTAARDTNDTLSALIRLGAEVRDLRGKSDKALDAYKTAMVAYVEATERYDGLLRAEREAARVELNAAENRIGRLTTQAESLAEQNGTTQAWLSVSLALNVIVLIVAVAAIIRFRPIVIERLFSPARVIEPEPIVTPDVRDERIIALLTEFVEGVS